MTTRQQNLSNPSSASNGRNGRAIKQIAQRLKYLSSQLTKNKEKNSVILSIWCRYNRGRMLTFNNLHYARLRGKRKNMKI